MGNAERRKLCVVCSQVFPVELAQCPEDGSPLVLADADQLETRETAAPSLVGAMLGSYRVLRVLGEGGVGTVYEAEHLRLGRKVAAKVLHPGLAAQQDVVVRLFNEARAVNEIRHPHIVDVEDFVAVGGHVYIVVERLEGLDLLRLIARAGPLAPERVAHIGAQVADALAAVHAVGILHRDLKPANVFLIERDGDRDYCKVLDFGIAKFATDERGLTKLGTSVGTPEYMAPEQILGRPVDARADIYSLGMVMYEALTGAPAFRSESYTEVLRAQCTAPVPPPSERSGSPVPAALEAIVMTCLEKAPEARFGRMEEVRDALRSGAAPPAPARRRGEVATVGATRRRGRQLQLLPALGIAAVALGFAYSPLWPAATPRRVASAPAPAPGPPPAPEIVITLVSKPAGAEVFVGPERRPAGATPTTAAVPPSAEPLLLTARFPGGVEVQETIVPDRTPPPVVFVLPAAPAAAPPPAVAARPEPPRPRAVGPRPARRPAAKQGKAATREGVIDPFK
ncbi:MAG: serine/threonine protein kinase [Deltaproteobacteria bacterium]|nr:serine/threonine protein kinase [Deltaproteobacteria bacterium]